ncbi:MAG: cytochrome c biogenesis protein, partial [Proteobacteria bacterium]|nr:cytochrome c biogenesis protein [Pseudomonadota bacterium]MBU1709210.1 cytochrome c biogenesis protein [Pseudomonadota bacterium]
INLCSPKPHFQKSSGWLHGMTAGLYVAGFLLICWFHYCINRHLPLELPAEFIQWLNLQLQSMNAGSPYPLPLYDALAPPRYTIPVWIENEKYYFWFLCYALLASIAYLRIKNHRLMGFIHLILAIQTAILFFGTDPFTDPLPQFFREISPWFSADITPFNRLGLFMRLYPKMIFYYNAHYMWFHPPLLFISYACITLTFAASVFMLINRELSIETLGYGYAKMGYFVLTLGMLLGYPWALQAWGPNWWWDPKICSSLMMWAIYSTYLHTRLYANKPGMWYFSSALGILCFLAMIFTFISSFFFPGEHTFQ